MIRTLDGSDGRARDHTTGIETPLGNTRRPSRIRNPRRVYPSDGNVFFRAVKRRRPPDPPDRERGIQRPRVDPQHLLLSDLGTSRSHHERARVAVNCVLSFANVGFAPVSDRWTAPFHRNRQRCHSSIRARSAVAPGRNR